MSALIGWRNLRDSAEFGFGDVARGRSAQIAGRSRGCGSHRITPNYLRTPGIRKLARPLNTDAALKRSQCLSAEFGRSSGIRGTGEGKRARSGTEPTCWTRRKDWLGDLDSNQDSQIQSLESYQLDDLPADGRKKKPRQDPEAREGHDSSYLI